LEFELTTNKSFQLFVKFICTKQINGLLMLLQSLLIPGIDEQKPLGVF